MLDQDQAALIYDLVTRVLAFDGRGNIVGTPPCFDRATISDALATLEAEKDGAGGRALVVDPEFDGTVTRMQVELAAARVQDTQRVRSNRDARQRRVARLYESSEHIATIVNLDIEDDRELAESTEPNPNRDGRRVCTVYSIVDASTVFASVTGVTISTDMLRSMGDSVTLSSGHTIVRAGDAWELWSRWS